MTQLAERQHGVVALWQLTDAGLTRGWIDLRLARRRLHPLYPGVYAVGHPVLTIEGRWMACVLAGGRDAVLSHRSAAALWQILPTSESAWIHITRPSRRGARRRKGLVVHRPGVPVDVTAENGIPVTTVMQTLLDLAATVDRTTVEQAVDAAERRGLVEAGAEVPAGRNGARLLREVLGEHVAAPTRSELERRFLVLCREDGIPAPEVNTIVAGVEVDMVWHAWRLVVELDGGNHRSRIVFESDHERDARLTLAGYRTERFTWQQVTEAPERVAAVVRAAMRV